MLAACGGHGPLHIPALAGPAGRPPDRCGPAAGAGARWRRRAGNGEAPRPVVARAGAGLSSFFSSPIGLDSQTFQPHDSSQLLWVGPVPGDIAEVEAYCRIFRAAEQLHAVIMKTLCDPETGECAVSYTTPSEDLQLLEDRVVALLGCMVALLNRGREDVLSGRSSFANSHDGSEGSTGDEKLPPLAVFRREMKRCCESLQVALSNYLTPFENRSADIWTRLQRLKNVCYDAGFARSDGFPPPTLFANWSPVYFSSGKEDRLLEDSEAAFWKGGQVTEEGLRWLLEKGYRTIVDLREEAVKDGYYQSAVGQAVSRGEVEVVNLPVEVGTAPSMEQVEKFASLVSDPNRRPLYLHSQEGVNRTSAMVSRWRQHISRSSIKVVSNHHVNLNGTLPEDARDVDNLFVSPKLQGGTRVDDKNDSQSELDAAYNHNGTFSGQGSFAAQNEHESVKVTQQRTSVHDSDTTNSVKVESFANFSMENDPFMAQAPRCDIFSRRQMTSFLKNKKISPTTYLNSQRRKSEILSIQRDACMSPVQSNKAISTQLPGDIPDGSSNGTSRDRDASFGSNDIRISDGKHVSREVSPSFGATVNGINGGESCIAINPEHSSNVDNSSSRQSLSTAIGEPMREKNNGSPDSVGDSLDVEGNMCASTTGVVRVQSRKKAEMFLVRTDGFSCTREKVTESSLAFTHPSTQQQMLMWKSPPKTVLLLKKLGNELMEEAKEVAAYLFYQEKMNVLVEPDVHDIFARIPGFGFVQTFYSQDTSDLHERVDLVACLGGDGVILHASNLFRGAVPPVVSFNLGSLGFLTSHTFEEYRQDLRAVIHGNNTLDGVYITLRMRLRCEVFRNGKAMPGKVFDVLNEVVVDRGSNPYLSKIECYEHNRLITKVQGDGVIVATPTGSTAYSTAAGGSMVHPNVPCMLFTPICPHSLSFRPVILPDSARLELKIPQETRNNAWVSFDGKRRHQLSRGDSVRICMSQHPLPTVNKSDQTGDWFHSLIRCLNWNERLDQKAL